MPKSRLIAIGDIHGKLELLEDLIAKIKPRNSDRLVFCGDYVDRGPSSLGVIEYLADLQLRFPKTVLLCGNHDYYWMLYATGQPGGANQLIQMLEANREFEMLDELGLSVADLRTKPGSKTIPLNVRMFLSSLQLYYEQKGFLFIHAGVPIGEHPRDRKHPDEFISWFSFLWMREPFLSQYHELDGLVVVHGHTPGSRVLVEGDKINIDTGAAYATGHLSGIDVLTGKIYEAFPRRS